MVYPPLVVIVPPVPQEAGVTVTITDCRVEVPPAPVHWKVKVVFVVSGSVKPLPERVPAFDQFPLGVQLVALVELHVSVDWPPLTTEVGEAESVAVGAGKDPETSTVALQVFEPTALVAVPV